MNEIAERILEAIDNRKQVAQAYADAQAYHLQAKTVLNNTVGDARARGEIEGKNADERDANARITFSNLYNDLYNADRELIFARMHFENAVAELEGLSAIAEGSRPILLQQAA